ncbi:MAG: RdgB/HAM1 family non-canonical purine NTP pyrophosphatase [Planctomycetaceae bacterium]|nr:RdgB/HAM1 family non-canonical purine NTP pyrophosphatase [Planctomycetaceae bacterium]
MTQPTIVLGTHNVKKGAELREFLLPRGVQLTTLADFPNAIEVVEDGDSFAANAALKATQQAVHLQQWVIGEDSGLSVDALNGAPGIFSARYSGADATDQSNNDRLLLELAEVPVEQRSAFYTCHVAVSDPSGQVRLTCEETCRGRIRVQPAGNAGFGYDPLFELVEYHRTFGQLGGAVKSVLSHRARAMRQFVPQLVQLLMAESIC